VMDSGMALGLILVETCCCVGVVQFR